MNIDHLGQRVQHPYCPEHRGTVTRLAQDGSFRISWDSHGRRRNQSRVRAWYSPRDRGRFVVPGDVEVRIVEDDTIKIDIPDALAKAYGIG